MWAFDGSRYRAGYGADDAPFVVRLASGKMEGAKMKRSVLLGVLVFASATWGVGWGQSLPMPTVPANHSINHQSYSQIFAEYCTYNWGYAYNCRYLTGGRDETGNYIELWMQSVDTINFIYRNRDLRCRVKAGAWRANDASANIPAIALDTTSPDCSTSGSITTCGENGCETSPWSYWGVITVEGAWSNPKTASQANSMENVMDYETGVRSHYVCNDERANEYRVGGWSFNGNYYPVGVLYADDGNPTVAGDATRYEHMCTRKDGP